MADTDLLMMLRSYADKLGAVLYERGKAKYPRQSGPQRYLFLTSPQDVRAWQPGDDINLVCLSDNRAPTFWSYVAEVQDDEPFALECKTWTRHTHLAESYDRYVLAALPGAGALTIQHAPLPPHFDIALVGGYGIPEFPDATMVSSFAARRLHAVRNAVKAQGRIDDCILEAYMTLRRDWAEPRGIFSKDMGPLDASELLKLILKVEGDYTRCQDLIDAFLEEYSCTIGLFGYGSEDDDNPTNFFDSDAYFVGKAAQQYRAQSSDCLSHDQHAINFLKQGCQYVLLEYRSWSSESSISAWQELVLHTRNLRKQIFATHLLDVRAWPSPFETETTDPEELGLTIVLQGSKPSTTANADLEDTLEFFSQHYYEKLVTSKSAVSVRLVVDDMPQLKPLRVLELADRDLKLAADLPSSIQMPTSEKQKLRTAGQTLSRLRWDPTHRSKSYDVGYTDRFDGLKWIPLEQWGKPVEDDDFIPEHRIQQFRLKSTGQIVWDRAKKLDLTGQ